MTGVYAILCIIKATCKVYGITTGKVKIGCDNDQVVRNASLISKKVPQKLRSVDLVRAIRRVKSSIPVQLEFIQVTGHLDDKLEFEDLDRESQLNVVCDTMAKRVLKAAVQQNINNGGSVPHEEWGISLGKIKLIGTTGKHIRNMISHSEMRGNLHNKGKMTWRIFNQVDWNAIRDMMNESTCTFRVWISKHV